jgi:hypothetical protein
MDQWKIRIMRELEREYYGERKDHWKEFRYIVIRVVGVVILAIVVLSLV